MWQGIGHIWGQRRRADGAVLEAHAHGVAPSEKDRAAGCTPVPAVPVAKFDALARELVHDWRGACNRSGGHQVSICTALLIIGRTTRVT